MKRRPEAIGLDPATIGDHLPGLVAASQRIEETPMSIPVQPWGINRLALYPNTVRYPFTRTEIDPETQATRYFDPAGRAVDMSSAHGTNQSTASPTATGSDGGGSQPPAPADSDALEDHVPD
ncbi:putative ATP-grasp target RiPP [Streptomyces sp. 840.1]|uniref:putative ATP-grasp-modified RiPP n=1 Tax=Streptomyces sp. 840.1 TaxID=2485152 RepID=UPI000FAC686B|nr:putative ATP-grasp-modified RiPP [Streptomyces sp. 840.1]ROQ66898.1 putative ATP-grasp target RiPP [Streptomyces sp. 840.1]